MERIADHFRNVFTSMSTYVSAVKTKASVKDETPLADVDNSENVRILPSFPRKTIRNKKKTRLSRRSAQTIKIINKNYNGT